MALDSSSSMREALQVYLAVTRELTRPPITGLHLQFVDHGDTLNDNELWEVVCHSSNLNSSLLAREKFVGV